MVLTSGMTTHTRTHIDTHTHTYLVPGTQYPSGEHEEVTHGNQTRPDEEGEETQHPLEDRLDAYQDEDGEEEEECGGDCDQEHQVVLVVLHPRRERPTD